jgi:hypothetical protein
MSIATLKKKTATKYNNMSVNVPNFSINGTHRSAGWVGQTTLSRSLPKTILVGITPKGSGGCCGTYNLTNIVQSAVTSKNDNKVIKPSVLSNDGMIATKYRWIRRPTPFTSVKPGYNNNLNDQSDYITRKSKGAIFDTTSCAIMNKPESICGDPLFKCDETTVNVTKNVYTKTEGQYVAELSDECANTIDIQFQNQNASNCGTPFAGGI